ncbi:hypothetical protein ABPG72_018703 [Tetrahymena utriculariae]
MMTSKLLTAEFFLKALLLSLLISNCVCASSNFDCTQYFSSSLNCQDKITNFDRQLIKNVIGNAPILLKNKLEWATKASSRYFKCKKEAVHMCLSLSVDTDNLQMASQECRENITQDDSKNIFQLQQAVFTNSFKNDQELIERLNLLEAPQSSYFSCLVSNISFQLKSKSNQKLYQY